MNAKRTGQRVTAEVLMARLAELPQRAWLTKATWERMLNGQAPRVRRTEGRPVRRSVMGESVDGSPVMLREMESLFEAWPDMPSYLKVTNPTMEGAVWVISPTWVFPGMLGPGYEGEPRLVGGNYGRVYLEAPSAEHGLYAEGLLTSEGAWGGAVNPRWAFYLPEAVPGPSGGGWTVLEQFDGFSRPEGGWSRYGA